MRFFASSLKKTRAIRTLSLLPHSDLSEHLGAHVLTRCTQDKIFMQGMRNDGIGFKLLEFQDSASGG